MRSNKRYRFGNDLQYSNSNKHTYKFVLVMLAKQSSFFLIVKKKVKIVT